MISILTRRPKLDKGKKNILAAGSGKSWYVLFRPVHERLAADPRLDFWFTGRNLAGKNRPEKDFMSWGLSPKRIIREKASNEAFFDLFITPVYHYIEGCRNRFAVQTFHTTSFRHVSIDPRIKKYDRFFIYGDYMKRKFVEKGILSKDDPRFVMIGMPVLDRLVDGSLDSNKIKSDLKIDNGKPTVIYAPTCTTLSTLFTDGFNIIDTICNMDVNFLMKPHYDTYDMFDSPVDWAKEFARISKKYPNFREIKDLDIVPYMYVSDTMISDASSVIWQFLVLDRPVIFMDFDMEKFKENWPMMDFEPWGRKMGPVVKTKDDLIRSVEDAIGHPERYGELRRACAADNFYKPGTATERTVSEIYKLLGIEPA
ncbi:MAG: CDP-glycerol glycerophosphotransferase family protein [Candidatus Omnitrophica bacterium]|nr:CDP-glycerol glycerophosphotransferase family protein [Candidatus Omnitrophota bacterium]